jgi:nucleotide-binding universal stress UspA family protein
LLNEVDRLDTLLEFTADLAKQEEAHVIGLYVIPASAVFPATGGYVLPEVFDSFTKYFEDQLPRAKAKFEAFMASTGVTWQWMQTRSAAPAISDAVSFVGRLADIVVLSEIDRKEREGVELDLIQNVVLSVGRPVIVLPRQVATVPSFTRVLCAFNGSREATRAVHDALPILVRAEAVQLLWVDPLLDRDLASLVPSTELAESLKRHGVKVTTDTISANGANPVEALLARAQHLGAGLIVMGAYGHSRLREFVLGGATREALTSLTIPLLLSH